MRDIDREELISELLALKPEFERRGVLHAALFGSRARGDNSPNSDIDLLIQVDESRQVSLLDLAGVYGVIEDRLGLPSSLIERQGLDEPFLRRVVREQVPIF